MGVIKKILLSRIKIFLWLDIILLLLLFVLFICGRIFYEPIKNNSPVLFSDTSLHVSRIDLQVHNTYLISTLQERESSDANSVSSENEGLRQTRSIYIAITCVILTFVFNKNESDSAYIFLLVLITLFYGLDIHLLDMLGRSTDSKNIASKALELVVKQRPNDSTWYDINNSERNYQFDRMHDTRIARKLCAAFQPDIVQTIFFVLPFFILYVISTLKYRKKQYAA